MYTKHIFERSPFRNLPIQNTTFLSPLFSHTSALPRPHPLSFDTLPQNTRGWGIGLKNSPEKLPICPSAPPPKPSTLRCQLLTLLSPLTPLLPLDTKTGGIHLL